MKKIREVPLELADRLALPGEILPGSASVCITGGRQALVQGQRGVLEYSAERVVLALKRGKLCINGSSLQLRAMKGEEIIISGRIGTVEWG